MRKNISSVQVYCFLNNFNLQWVESMNAETMDTEGIDLDVCLFPLARDYA